LVLKKFGKSNIDQKRGDLMLRSTLCLVAEGVIRDAETNNVSVYNILESITAQGFPLFLSKLGFLAVWEKETTDPIIYRANFSITLNEQQLYAQDIPLDFQNNIRLRSIITVQGVVIPQPGQMNFRLTTESGQVANFTLTAQAVQGAIRAG
jgi:hypothetical protein